MITPAPPRSTARSCELWSPSGAGAAKRRHSVTLRSRCGTSAPTKRPPPCATAHSRFGRTSMIRRLSPTCRRRWPTSPASVGISPTRCRSTTRRWLSSGRSATVAARRPRTRTWRWSPPSAANTTGPPTCTTTGWFSGTSWGTRPAWPRCSKGSPGSTPPTSATRTRRRWSRPPARSASAPVPLPHRTRQMPPTRRSPSAGGDWETIGSRRASAAGGKCRWPRSSTSHWAPAQLR